MCEYRRLGATTQYPPRVAQANLPDATEGGTAQAKDTRPCSFIVMEPSSASEVAGFGYLVGSNGKGSVILALVDVPSDDVIVAIISNHAPNLVGRVRNSSRSKLTTPAIAPASPDLQHRPTSP